jgi:hypothetical protein
MRSLIAGIVFLGLAGAVSAQDTKFVSKEGKYSVAFPGKPTTSTEKKGDLVLNITILPKGDNGLLVIYSDLSAEAAKDTKPKEILEAGEKSLVDAFKAKVSKSKEIEFGEQKIPGREIYAVKDDVQLRITIILADKRLYQVLAVGAKDFVEGKDTEEFFKSFEIVK